MFQFENGEMIAAANHRTPGIFSMFQSMKYIYTDSDVKGPESPAGSIAGWRGGKSRPDDMLWGLTVLLVAFQVYRYRLRVRSVHIMLMQSMQNTFVYPLTISDDALRLMVRSGGPGQSNSFLPGQTPTILRSWRKPRKT